MNLVSLSLTILAGLNLGALDAGDHARSLTVDGRERSYLVHIPDSYDAMTPTPVVLILHGAGTDADITVTFTGMNEKSDEKGFIAVYPNGTGRKPLLTWNAGGSIERFRKDPADDVAFIDSLLDELERTVTVDRRRVFATGMSNGGMMCYRLAAEMSERIAAIAPVAGTLLIDDPRPARPVPVMHFHGREDRFVVPEGPGDWTPGFLNFKSVEETMAVWCRINGCSTDPMITELPDEADDGTRVTRSVFTPQGSGAEIVLYEIEGGGHTWPGQRPPVRFIGRSTMDISANDLIWEFFERHPMTDLR
ncbi:MAG: polyhydroxybutyrate depolymerase [Planctomycetaceae bacterium]|nr:polyhydroxybutyrate depolymerase [Planctomycetaceae bacterium]